MTDPGAHANDAGVHPRPGELSVVAVADADCATSNALPQRIPSDLDLEPWVLPSVELYEVIVAGLRNMDAATNLPDAGVSNHPASAGQEGVRDHDTG